MYKNQGKVDKIQEQIQEIDPSLKIRSCSVNGRNEVNSVELVIPVKGNKRIMEELKRQGWKNTFREKKRTDNSIHTRCQYEGYIFVQRMELRI